MFLRLESELKFNEKEEQNFSVQGNLDVELRDGYLQLNALVPHDSLGSYNRIHRADPFPPTPCFPNDAYGFGMCSVLDNMQHACPRNRPTMG
jgi:hypothetical protein